MNTTSSSLFYYKLVLSYDGTNYAGWQIQPNVTTVQGLLDDALLALLKEQTFKTLGSGRTDAGVHALGQVVRVELKRPFKEAELRTGLNAFLPQSIRVKSVKQCSAEFHPQISATRKTYRYCFSMDGAEPLLAHQILFHRPNLDIEKMRRAASYFLGTHDFSNFKCTGTPTTTSTRTIFRASIHEYSHPYIASLTLFAFEVEGSGFLKQMVRQMMGALLAVGQGKMDESIILEALKRPLESRPWATAKPHGLYLVNVSYEEQLD